MFRSVGTAFGGQDALPQRDRVGRVRAAGREDQRPDVEVAGGREAPCSGELPETLERGPRVADAAVVLGVVDRDGPAGRVSRAEHDRDALPVGLVVEAGDAADAEARAAERAAARMGRVVGQVPPVVEIDQAVAALGIRQRVRDVDIDAARDTGVRQGMAVERQVVEAALEPVLAVQPHAALPELLAALAHRDQAGAEERLDVERARDRLMRVEAQDRPVGDGEREVRGSGR